MSTDETARPRLEEIEARAEGASEGPWATDRTFWKTQGARGGWWREVTDEHGTVALLSEQDDGPETGTAEASAAFIAAARTDVPALTAALRDVLALAEDWRYQGEFGWGPRQAGDGPSPEGRVLDRAAAELRRAITAHIDVTSPTLHDLTDTRGPRA